ncbi:MAG: discoidin domain-containing protein [Cellulosilyticaceae bacterium]
MSKNFKQKMALLMIMTMVFSGGFLGNTNVLKADEVSSVKVIRTAKDGEMGVYLPEENMTEGLSFTNTDNIIRIYSGETKQEIIGFGGALTESAVSVINKLESAKQQEIYDAYFGEEGSNYNMIRTHIGSCDFSLSNYSYNDMPKGKTDSELNNFTIDPDREDIIPAIKRAQSYNAEMKIVAAPWAPPAWMKKSGDRYGKTGTAGMAFVDNSVKPEYYASYANYLAKYIEAYGEEGIPIWAMSMQNEAQNNPKWEAATFNPKQAKTFIGDYLGPTLAERAPNTKLLIWDWDKGNDPMHADGFVDYNTEVLSDSNAARYIWGIGFHWYAGDLKSEITGEPMWSKDFYSLQEIKKAFPDINLIATEACQEKGAHLREWTPAARYSYDIINDLKNGTQGWLDWNIVLNSQGGPTHNVINKCHAPIMVDFKDENIQADDEIIYNPAYYILNQFSKNIKPGACVVLSTSNFNALDHVALVNPDGSIVLFVGNNTNNDIQTKIMDGSYGMDVTIKANSMTTFMYDNTANECNSIARGKVTTASSYQVYYGDPLVPDRVVDGNTTSRWASEWNDNEWIGVDLENVYTLAGLEIDWENGYNNDYQIEISSDGENWQSVYVAAASDKTYNLARLRFAPIEGRYIRMHGLKRNAKYGYSIYEMRVITK